MITADLFPSGAIVPYLRHACLVLLIVLHFCVSSSAIAQQNKNARYWHPSLNLRDADTQTLVKYLKRLRIELPFSLEGKISVSLQGGVPITRLLSATAYELDGSISSPRLVISGIEVRDVHAAIRYRDGIMQLQTLRFILPPERANDNPVTVTGSATLPLSPRGDLRLSAGFTELSWSRIGKWLSIPDQFAGKVAGNAELKLSGTNFRAINSWTGSAQLHSESFRFREFALPTARLNLNIANSKIQLQEILLTGYGSRMRIFGELTINEDRSLLVLAPLQIDTLGGNIRIDGALPLRTIDSREFRVAATGIDLKSFSGELRKAIADRFQISLPANVSGVISAKGEITLPLHVMQKLTMYRARLEVESPQMVVGPVSVRNPRTSINFNGSQLDLNSFRWEWPAELVTGGSVEGNLHVPFSLFGKSTAELVLQNFPAEMASSWFDVGASGLANGKIRASVASLSFKDPNAWTFDIDITGDNLKAAGVNLALKTLSASWRASELQIRNTLFEGLGQRVEASGSLQLAQDVSSIVVKALKVQSDVLDATLDGTWPISARRDGKLQLSLNKLDLAYAGGISIPEQIVFEGFSGILQGRATASLSSVQGSDQRRRLSTELKLEGPIQGQASAAGAIGDRFDPAAWGGSASLKFPSAVRVLGRSLEDVQFDAEFRNRELDLKRLSAKVDVTPIRASGKLSWVDQPHSLAVTDFRVSIADGSFLANGRVPLAKESPISAQIKFVDVDLGILRTLSPQLVRVTGRISGDAKAEWDPERNESRSAAVISAKVRSDQILIGPLKLSTVAADVNTDSGKANYSLTAQALGGRFTVEGTEALRDGAFRDDSDRPIQSKGRVEFGAIQLSRFANLKKRANARDSLSGDVSAAVRFERKPKETFQGEGQFEVNRLRAAGIDITDRMRAAISLRGNSLQVQDLTGTLFGGSAAVSIAGNLDELRKGIAFSLVLRRVNLAQVSEVLFENPNIAGRADLRVEGKIGKQILAQGLATGERSTAYEQQIGSWQAPFDLTWNPLTGDGKLTVTRISSQLANGQLNGGFDYQWGQSSRIAANATFVSLDIQPLLKSAGSLKNYGQGRVTGTANLQASPFRSADDLSGKVKAKLTGVQGGQMPVIEKVLPLVAGATGNATVFRDGVFEGTLGKGTFKVQKLNLYNPNVKLTANGSVYLSGRLDLSFHVATGKSANAVNNPQLQSLLPMVLKNANPTVAVITRVNRLLADRVIAFSVTGTIANPIVRVQPIPTLTNEGIRFLIGGDYNP